VFHDPAGHVSNTSGRPILHRNLVVVPDAAKFGDVPIGILAADIKLSLDRRRRRPWTAPALSARAWRIRGRLSSIAILSFLTLQTSCSRNIDIVKKRKPAQRSRSNSRLPSAGLLDALRTANPRRDREESTEACGSVERRSCRKFRCKPQTDQTATSIFLQVGFVSRKRKQRPAPPFSGPGMAGMVWQS
jgi:hypothetical protein